jgi:hypothetical protein
MWCWSGVRNSGSALEMKKGQISLTPYFVVEQLLLRGEAELVWRYLITGEMDKVTLLPISTATATVALGAAVASQSKWWASRHSFSWPGHAVFHFQQLVLVDNTPSCTP